MFKKYSSIENSYQQKYILKALELHPQLKDMKYSIREKIDGSNLQLYFEPRKEMLVGKRTSFLENGDKFFDVWNVLEKYKYQIEKIQQFTDSGGISSVRIFGELYGKGIQKRVNYGEDKYLAFFDIEVNGKMLSQQRFEELMFNLQILDFAPLIGYADSLSEALEFREDFDSKILGIENNPAEGIVIKPYTEEISMGPGQRFILKKKSDIFSEKMKVKPGKKRTEEATKMINAKVEFQSYINDNRLQGIFSKHGEIQDQGQFGKYIQLMLADVREDFLKDYDVSDLTEKELKKVFSGGGKHIALLLKGYL